LQARGRRVTVRQSIGGAWQPYGLSDHLRQ